MKIQFYVYLVEDALGNTDYDVCRKAGGPIDLAGNNAKGEIQLLLGADTDQAWSWADRNGFKLRSWHSTFNLTPGADDEKVGSGKIERIS